MRDNNSGRVVLITGATQGIGKATANLLLKKGFKVYGTSRNPDQASSVTFPLIKLDITDNVSVKECIKQVISKEGRIDVLINNISYPLCGSIADVSSEELQQQFDTNFFGMHRMISEVLPIMLSNDYGKIINLGSIAGRAPLPYQASYSSSKAAIANYTDSLRMELFSRGIRVVLIEPSDTNTAVHSSRVYAKGFDEDLVAQNTIELMHKFEMAGASPKTIAKSILKAIKKKNPKPRYTFGFQSFLVAFLFRFLPISVQIWGLMLFYNIPRKKK